MESKKRHGHSGRPRRNYNQGPNHRSSQSRGNRTKSQFVCESCGANAPGYGNVAPMCPRCMIPMQSARSNRQGYPNSKGSGQNGRKKGYDYSPRIYYQTEGHPQYINLPVGHPDPDDEEAVAAYLARKDSKRSGRRSDKRASQPRSDKQSQSRPARSRHDQKSRQPRKRSQDGIPHQERAATAKDTAAPHKMSPAESRRKPLDPRRKPERKSERKLERNTDDRPKTDPRKVNRRPQKKNQRPLPQRAPEPTKAAPLPPVNPADFAGTALTTDRSPVSILNSTIAETADEPTPDFTGSLMSSNSAEDPSANQGSLPFSKPESKPEPKPEIEVDAKPEAKPVPEPDAKPAPKPRAPRKKAVPKGKSETVETEKKKGTARKPVTRKKTVKKVDQAPVEPAESEE